MDVSIVAVGVGSALVIIIDLFKSIFPNAGTNIMRGITLLLAVIFSVILMIAHENQTVEYFFHRFLEIIGTSQILYGLVWKDTSLHKTITDSSDIG